MISIFRKMELAQFKKKVEKERGYLLNSDTEEGDTVNCILLWLLELEEEKKKKNGMER